jgi:KUP system potassium uptake protein
MKSRMKDEKQESHTMILALGALGVVFGDIGTSPLYALRQCFIELHGGAVDAASLLGILSLIFWSLVLVVCVKYVTFILRADHDGEGGTLALLALILNKRRTKPSSRLNGIILLVFFGSALLYGDGVITPSISVLSAVEGLKVATPDSQYLIVPLSLGILVALFLFQSRGTGKVGNLFGPIMAVWFLALAGLGISGILQAPQVLAALNPAMAADFMLHHGGRGVIVLGAVVLCFTGAEALFADLSHFGRLPIRLGWYGLVFPALVLNYFGQGALILQHPTRTGNPFFLLVPHGLIYPAVALATAATVIASQALISGAFCLTAQAIHLGYLPRMRVVHTSKEERGQIYIAGVNYLLMLACVAVVLGFRSSERLGGAYGLAVIGTMLVTSITYYLVVREVWKWPRAGAIPLVAFFLLLDVSFLAGNVTKIVSGAWVPLTIAAIVFAIFWIWTTGRRRYGRALRSWGMPLDEFRRDVKGWKERHDGSGVFLTTHANFVPLVGRNHWLREHCRHEQLFLVTVDDRKIPYVPEDEMARVEELGNGFWRISVAFGFMQPHDLMRVLKSPALDKLAVNFDRLVFYVPEAQLEYKGGWWRQRLGHIYEFLGCNTLSAANYFYLPARDVIHIGVKLRM